MIVEYICKMEICERMQCIDICKYRAMIMVAGCNVYYKARLQHNFDSVITLKVTDI